MRKPKLKKYPKKPKASASLATKQNWLQRKAGIDAENQQKVRDYKESTRLSGIISGVKQMNLFSPSLGRKHTHKRKFVKRHKRWVSGVKRKKSSRRKKR